MITYQIMVQGGVDPGWSDWIDGMEVRVESTPEAGEVTTFTGGVVDQAALRGIVNRLWDLNLTLLAIRVVRAPHGEPGAQTAKNERTAQTGAYGPEEMRK